MAAGVRGERRAVSRRAFLRATLGGAALVLGGCSGQGGKDPAVAPAVPTVLDEAAPDELTVLMVGDILVHRGVWESGQRADGTRDYGHLFANVADDVSAADVALVNQETILGGEEVGPFSGYPVFNGPQEIGDAEVAAGFDVVLCATNHACDKGMAGIESELGFWRSSHPGVVVAGMADSQEAYDAVPMIERANHRIAVLNYTYGMNGIPLPEPWAAHMLDEDAIARDADAAREAGAEAIVACPHWGVEYAAAPSDDQRHWAKVLADAGADVIVGGHPHVIQPFETIEDASGRVVPVFWSMGNFTSTQPRKDTMVGGMATATLVFDGDACEVRACRLAPLVTHRADGTAFTTYRLSDYTEELASANQIRTVGGCEDFTRRWCVDFCSERLGGGFDADACELVWEA